jgi:hypothetical protein
MRYLWIQNDPASTEASLMARINAHPAPFGTTPARALMRKMVAAIAERHRH